MIIVFWILILLISIFCAWGVRHYRRQNLRLQKLQHALLKAYQKKHAQDDKYTENRAQWEQTGEKLRHFLQLMDTLMNTIPNPIYFKNAKGVYQGCNKAFAKQIMGLNRDRIIGKRPHELPDHIPAGLASIYQREELKMIQKTGIHTFETTVQCADGKSREFLFSLAPVMDYQSEFRGSVAVLWDLTDKNRATRNRIQKEKLEGVLETAGAVCHEFNQPLQAITGYMDLIAIKPDGGKAHSYFEKVTAQIERMGDITDKLQSITRYETMNYAGDMKIIDIRKASAIK